MSPHGVPIASPIHHGPVGIGKRIVRWVPPVVGGAVVAGLGVFLAAAGLDDADKWASVVGLFVALAGLALTGYGLVAARQRTSAGRPGQTVTGSAVGGGVTQVRGVGGDLRLGPAPTPLPGCRPPETASPAPRLSTAADAGDQAVTDTWTAGPVRQVDDVGGDADIDR